jgi:hypothetical protein
VGGFVSDVRERLRLHLKGLRRPIGALPQAHSGRADSSEVSAPVRPQPDWVVLRRRLHGGPRDLANVARYDETDLPLDDLNYITDNTMVVFGWLASRAFYLWQQTVLAGNPRATTLQAYNTFPAPKLGKKDRAALEEAARTILVSRSHLMAGSLADLYAELPEQLAWAHTELDNTVDRLLGIPDDVDDQQATTVLLKAYESLAA